MASLEEEYGRMYVARSHVRRKKLQLMALGDNLTKAQCDTMKEDVNTCKEWEAFIHGWREALEWEKEDNETRLEREARLVAEGSLGLEGGLAEALTCPNCRVTFQTGWIKRRHR
jgi:hypothetical protein